jgi:uncharacterized protein (DUF433 family)
MTFTRITVNPMQIGGVPCIRGRRIPVATVIEMMADGMTPKEILGALPDLEAGDIDEALHFAAYAAPEIRPLARDHTGGNASDVSLGPTSGCRA